MTLLFAFGGTGFIIWALRPLAHQTGLVDHPGGRKNHAHPTPMVGGLGIFLGSLLAIALLPGAIPEYKGFLALSALVLFMGTIDDVRELNALTRLVGQGLVGLVMALVAGVTLNSLGNIAGTDDFELGVFAVPLTVFATVGVINAINMSDGVDGLSGGLSCVTLVLIAAAALIQGNSLHASFLAILIFATLAFLTLNFRRPIKKSALVYLGDAGSTMLGFMLAWLLIDATQGQSKMFSPVHALWFAAVPLMDTVNLLIKRPLAGHSPLRAGHDHFHHYLMRRGLSTGKTVALIIAIAIFFGLIGLAAIAYDINEQLMFTLFLATFAVYYFISGTPEEALVSE